MGNWRTVHIVGTIPKEDLSAMRAYFVINEFTINHWNCLMITDGLFGLGMWINEEVNAVGNLSERDYTPKNVLEVLEYIGKHWPKVSLKVHCGGEWEDKKCIATVVLNKGKAYFTSKPEIKEIGEIPQEKINKRLFLHLTHGGVLSHPATSKLSGNNVKCTCGGIIHECNIPDKLEITHCCEKCGTGLIPELVDMLDVFSYNMDQIKEGS